MLTAIKDAGKIRIAMQLLFYDLRRINVYTTADSGTEVLARTTVELDADVVTLLNTQLVNMNKKIFF